ncbi:MAG: UDP-N-acetylmuramoyl-tripeptide--D-alanyl-D-alanine ligase, partial [Phycisphaeraceae bacterium]
GSLADASCSDKTANTSGPTLLVNDTIKSLQDLARTYRDELKGGGCKVIGIAGSNGKTTTRHLIHHVLTHAGLTGTQSPKSFNNHLGVPLTLLSAKPSDDFVAAEIGTNHPGEIDFLSAIARPDIAVITSIGEEHLEFFKDIEGVTKEELSIANHFNNQTLCIVGDSVPWHDSKLETAVMRGEADAYRAKPMRWVIDPDHEPSQQCAVLAARAAFAFGINEEAVEAALKTASGPPGRWEKLRFGSNILLINDAYNANPSSSFAAVEALCEQLGDRKVFVFGEMYELGDSAIAGHQTIGQTVCVCPIDLFIAVGPLTKHSYELAQYAKPSHYFESWSDDLPDQVAALLQPGDTVLLKASRGMRLERLIPAIERRFGPAKGDEPT